MLAFMALSGASRASEAELQVFRANALKPIAGRLARQFETISGHKVAVSFVSASKIC
jgi:ABC-type molybdate transport system substrate-binding protein